MRFFIWIIILALIVSGIYWMVNKTNELDESLSPSPVPPTPITQTPATSTVSTTTLKTVTVTYSSNGFSPSTVTINKGDTVKFVNQSSINMWVGVDAHPTHMIYDGTSLSEHCGPGADSGSFDSCKNLKNGESYSFKFDKVGSWGYHNHSLAAHSGTVVVK